MLEDYLNHQAQHTSAQRNEDGSAVMDSRGKISYLAPVSISCRRHEERREVLTAESQVIKVTTVYYLSTPLLVDDLLDSHRVQDVQNWVDLSGNTIGYKAVV